jgi:hypothetical protein
MADLNALIAQGAQFRVPPPIDPMGNMPQLMQMQSMQQQNQLNQMTMQEKQRGQQEMNALRGLMSSPGFDLSTPASQRELYKFAPTQAENILKGYYGNLKTGAEVKNLGFTGQETQAKLALEKQKHLGQMYRDISSRPSDANITAHAEDVDASPLYTPEEKATVNARAQRLLAMPMADRTAMLSQQGATAGELRPQVVAPGASLMRDATVVGTAPAAPDKAPAPTDLAKLQNERANLMPGDPRIAQYDDAIRKATTFAPSAQVNVKLPALESAEQKGKGELNVKAYGAVSDAARLATRTLPSLETQSAILDKGFRTGFGTDAQKAGASVLASLGIPEAAQFATDAQTFLASTQQAVLQRQLEQKGPQTESDAQRITQTGAQLGNTPEANRFLIDVAKGQYKRDIEQRSFFDKWWSQNKTYEGAEDAWYAGDGGKSLFARPELKKYAPKAVPVAAPVVGAKKGGYRFKGGDPAVEANWEKI